MIFKGSGVALVTPFNETGINYDVLKELIDWHIKSGTHALIIMGTTGEGATLRYLEKIELFKKALEFGKGRIKMIANTGSNDTASSIELSLIAQEMGYDGLLMVSPYYNKPTQRGLIAHFTAIADAVKIPIILYNVPGRCSVNLSAESCITLSKHPNIVGVKEASHDLVQIKQIIDGVDESFKVYSGNDDQNLDILKLGGYGIISVTANCVPERLSALCETYFKGDLQSAELIQKRCETLNEILFIESNPVPIKETLNLMGKNVGSVRLPLVELEDSHRSQLIMVLKQEGLI
ncbi:MAG: 4-hydroxy-tetrahydrodipicolinate synthase [Erysipelotrichaceae bacterium]